ncbi:MAG TPA: hypothetical protein VEI03_23820 [Stellaceae bacterium]|nr:hypothetical protein [Stellaceae bacterium]
MRALRLLVLVIVVAAGVVYYRFGTLEPCGILRMKMREQAQAQQGLNAMLASALPDQAVDALMAAEYGPLTPQRCLAALMGRGDGRPR